MPGAQVIQRRKIPDKQPEGITRALTISWAKELQLRIPAAFDAQLLPHLIQGAGHLSYYAVFHRGRALFLGSGQQFEPTHASALAALSTWVKDRRLFPAPWSVYVEGGPDHAAMALHGLPAVRRVVLIGGRGRTLDSRVIRSAPGSLLLEGATMASKDKGGSKSSKTAASKSLKEKRQEKKAKAVRSGSSSLGTSTK